MKKSVIRVFVIVLMVALLPLNVFAASSGSGNPYKDVTKKSVGKDAYTAIKYAKSHKGYVGFVKGKKFYPSKAITRRQFIIMLKNFYGESKVPVGIGDVINANKKATPKWATAKMVGVAKTGFGMDITWNDNSNKKMSRALASQYLYVFSHFDSAFKPLK